MAAASEKDATKTNELDKIEPAIIDSGRFKYVQIQVQEKEDTSN